MKNFFAVMLMGMVLSMIFSGCAQYQLGGYYYYPPAPYEYADPYNDYYYYNAYYYSYPYFYRFPPPTNYPDERGREFRYGEGEEKQEEEVK